MNGLSELLALGVIVGVGIVAFYFLRDLVAAIKRKWNKQKHLWEDND